MKARSVSYASTAKLSLHFRPVVRPGPSSWSELNVSSNFVLTWFDEARPNDEKQLALTLDDLPERVRVRVLPQLVPRAHARAQSKRSVRVTEIYKASTLLHLNPVGVCRIMIVRGLIAQSRARMRDLLWL